MISNSGLSICGRPLRYGLDFTMPERITFWPCLNIFFMKGWLYHEPTSIPLLSVITSSKTFTRCRLVCTTSAETTSPDTVSYDP